MQRVHIFSLGAVVVTAAFVTGVVSAWRVWSPWAQAETPLPLPEASASPTIHPSPEPTLGFSLEQFLEQKSTLLPADASLESFFQERVTETGSPQNLTEAYKAHAGQPGGKNLVDFVKAQPIVTTLPMVKVEEIITLPTSPEAIESYGAGLQTFGSLTYGEGLRRDLENMAATNNTAALPPVVDSWQKATADLRAQRVPITAVQLHRLLIGYTEAMTFALQEIAHWNEDRVAALVAIRQLDALDRTYTPIVEREMQKL